MKNLTDTGKIIVIVIAVSCLFFPDHQKIIGIIGAIILAIVLWIPHKLSRMYPYDMAKYIQAISHGNKAEAINILSKHASQCPYRNPNTCLKDKFCPDCPYGKCT